MVENTVRVITIFLLFPVYSYAQLQSAAQVQSQGAQISGMAGNLESTVIIGEPVVSGVIDHPGLGGSSFGFLGPGGQTGVPVAEAGPNQTVEPEVVVTLDGSNSFDPGGNPLTYTWLSLDGIVLNQTNSVQVSFTAPLVLGRQIFRFQLVVNNGQEDAVPDEVMVTISEADWIPVVYTNSSTLIGQVTINGLHAAAGDIVGAFVDGECRGWGEVFMHNNASFVSMNVQGETTATVDFRVIDMSEQQICDATATLAFSPPEGYGTPSSPFLIEANCNGSSNCDGVTLSNFTEPIPSGVYRASNNIISDDQVSPGATVVFQAANSISLQAGFRVQAGTVFTARIADCNTNPLINESTLKATAFASVPVIERVRIFPNPFSSSFTLSFYATAAERVVVRILDLHGRPVRTESVLEPGSGWFEKIYDLGDLPAGYCIIQLVTADRILDTKRVLKLK